MVGFDIGLSDVIDFEVFDADVFLHRSQGFGGLTYMDPTAASNVKQRYTRIRGLTPS